MATDDHRSALRRELVEAATRRASPAHGDLPAVKRRPVWDRLVSAGRGPIAVAACLIVAVAIFAAMTTLDTEPAAADVFTVRVTADEVVVTVDGLVSDPTEAERELEDAGLEVDLIDVPVPPSLVGAVVSTTSEFGALDADVRGTRILAFRIPRSETGPITIDYGRAADSGEEYISSEPVPGCNDLVGRELDESLAAEIAEQHGPEIVWQEYGAEIRTGILRDALASGAQVVTVLPLSPESVLVGVTDGNREPPSGSTC